MANYANRLRQLEDKQIKRGPVHVIFESYSGQPDIEVFEAYKVKRTQEGYVPEEGWDQLRTDFLSSSNEVGDIQFIIVRSPYLKTEQHLTNADPNDEL